MQKKILKLTDLKYKQSPFLLQKKYETETGLAIAVRLFKNSVVPKSCFIAVLANDILTILLYLK